MISDVLKTKDAAEFLGVSESTLKRWRAMGIGPRFIRLGKRIVRYRTVDLLDYVEGLSSLQCKFGSMCSDALASEAIRLGAIRLGITIERDGDAVTYFTKARCSCGHAACGTGPSLSTALWSACQELALHECSG